MVILLYEQQSLKYLKREIVSFTKHLIFNLNAYDNNIFIFEIEGYFLFHYQFF